MLCNSIVETDRNGSERHRHSEQKAPDSTDNGQKLPAQVLKMTDEFPGTVYHGRSVIKDITRDADKVFPCKLLSRLST